MGSRHIRGPLAFNSHKIVTTGNYTILNESLVVVNKTVGAATTITLPPSVTLDGRRAVLILDGKRDAATNNITVAAAGSDTINGAATYVIARNGALVQLIDVGGGAWIVETGSGGADSLFANLTLTGLLTESAADNITAFASGGQASATALTKELNRVVTVGTAGDSVKLPASAAGLSIIIDNSHATKAIQVFGAGTDKINDVATATGVNQMAQSVVIYTCYAAGNWYTEGLASGYSGSLATVSSRDSLTALAGGAQAGTALTTMINRFTTVTSANDSAQLPVSVAGLSIVVVNAAASNSMNVFGQTGDAINALSANTAFAVAANKTATFYCTAAGRWHTLLTA